LESQDLKNLRDFLEQREKELTDLLAEWERRAIPYDAEFAEIRRAQGALGTELPPGQKNGLRAYLEDRECNLRQVMDQMVAEVGAANNELAEVRKVMAAIGLRPTEHARFGGRFGQRFAEWESVPEAVSIPYQSMTIAELVTKALKEHFTHGAPIGAMLEFFRDKWGREIDKQSLSPQLSRLYQREVIGRIPSTQGWFLIQQEGRIPGLRPYLHEGRIVWDQPETVATNPHYEPLITHTIAMEDAIAAAEHLVGDLDERLKRAEHQAKLDLLKKL
jgi:hypothetical protein